VALVGQVLHVQEANIESIQLMVSDNPGKPGHDGEASRHPLPHPRSLTTRDWCPGVSPSSFSKEWRVLETDGDCAALRDQDRVRIVTAQEQVSPFGDYLLRISEAHITERELLNPSATSELFRGKWGSVSVVVKRFHVTANQGGSEEQLRHELDVIGRLRHPCLLTLYGVIGTYVPASPARARHAADGWWGACSGHSMTGFVVYFAAGFRTRWWRPAGLAGAGAHGAGLALAGCEGNRGQPPGPGALDPAHHDAGAAGRGPRAGLPAPPQHHPPRRQEPQHPARRRLQGQGMHVSQTNPLWARTVLVTGCVGSLTQVSGFGLSEVTDSSTSVVAATGTSAWMSPEALRGEEIRKDADMYSYGVVMWECATRERPWAHLQGKHRPAGSWL
jgi:hypothetical protein